MDELISEPAGPREEIAWLEDRIEALEAKLENCRKFTAAARFALAFGGVLLAGLVFGVIPFDPLALTAAMTAGLGGVVTLGSNKSTAQQITAELEEANARRASLIGAMQLRVVGGRDTLH